MEVTMPFLNVLGPLLVFTLWLYPSILVHELGHALAAKLLGLNPTHIIVGEVEPLFSFRVLRLTIVIALVPFTGLCLWQPSQTPSRWREFLAVLAGPLATLFLAAVAAYLFFVTPLKFTMAAIVGFELVQFSANMLPTSINWDGHEMPRDGARLLKLMRGS